MKTDFIPKHFIHEHLPQILAGLSSDMLHDYKTYIKIGTEHKSVICTYTQAALHRVPKLQY